MQSLSLSLKPYKPLLITLCIVLVIVVTLPLVGILSVEAYLKKALYPEIHLIIYENAQQTLSKTSWSWLGLPLLALDNALRPDLFLHLSELSYAYRMEAFDYTTHPATFRVTAVNQTAISATLDKIIPTMLKGETTQTQILCNKNTTTAVELLQSSSDPKTFMNSDGTLDLAKLQSNEKQLSIPATVFDFLVDQFGRSDIKAGAKHIELQTTCADRACSASGIVCAITIQ